MPNQSGICSSKQVFSIYNGSTYNSYFAANVGIGTGSPSHNLEVVAGGTTLADAWTTRSSRRFKENIRPIDDPLEKVQQLEGVYFDYKESKVHSLGLVAEEVEKVFPEVVSLSKDGKQVDGLDYSRLTAVLIEAVKAQQEQLNAEKKEIDALKARLEASDK